MLPRLCPERWVTTREYDPQSDTKSTTESSVSDSQECLPHLRSIGVRALGRHLPVEANELVYVLGKRSPQLWKVISHHTGQVGCVPTAILKPCTGNTRELTAQRDTSATPSPAVKMNDKANGSPSTAKSLMRNGRRVEPASLVPPTSCTPDSMYVYIVCHLIL
ncbi:unnamed protein product [Echinostoma caproni]|uniref:SH3 domain-containing protein n=1 Tax=Echinostoma caproni TaxID=27848 RepID=A0A183AIG8_9TREM|nr:unnamed protein product [Echinostoma caproni]